MAYTTYNGQIGTYTGKYAAVYNIFDDVPFHLSVIRNYEMDNIVGDIGSTDLSVNAVNGLELTVANLPDYYGYNLEASAWVAVPTTGTYRQYPTFCTSINYSTKTITLKDNAARFPVGTKIALYNPFLNYSFSGNQTSRASINISDLTSWTSPVYCGGGPLVKIGSTFKWMFYVQTNATYKYHQIGLATSTDAQTWTVQNNGGPWIEYNRAPDCSSLFPSGDIRQVDSSYYCVVTCNNNVTNLGEMRVMCFDSDISSLTFSPVIKTNAATGGIIKIGDYYHLLYSDISTAQTYRNVSAAKSLNLFGPYEDYQKGIAYGASAPTGVGWGLVTDSVTIHEVNGQIFGLFGGQGVSGVYSHGLGNINRQHFLLNFSKTSNTWRLNPKGPVLINVLDWGNTGSSDYAWARDHDSTGQNLWIDGGTAYLSNTFNNGTDTYCASMTILKTIL